ncbi:MAG: hypothetical protein CVV47_06950 [Spirochaetae bacterium HGW-Spirochaetae-3]|jgi:DNA-binding PadR family transcriptional regulator|nr:MAG: hypothetical protein CVV47_06950 [Spirochaetae bacterium HGW-Spirochaetae-3]
MATKDSVLALLSIEASTGYELKKRLSDSPAFSWVESSQVYKVLDSFQKEGLAEVEVDTSNDLGRKKYSITPKGEFQVKLWLEDKPELPEIKNIFQQKIVIAAAKNEYSLAQEITRDYRDSLLAEIKVEIQKQKRIEKIRSSDEDFGDVSSFPKPRKHFQDAIPDAVSSYRLDMLQAELQWVEKIQQSLGI